MSHPVILLLSLLFSLLSAGPASTPPRSEQPARGTTLIAIKNARVPEDGVLSGGQPSREQIEAAARAGVRTVINLRTDAESGFEWESAVVESLGLRFVHVPVAGAAGLTRELLGLPSAVEPR